ncbi:hypothetical protein [Robertmurraya kyonggiensis]|uniref:Uncharacterized protein n=1 Tax=Robertmurraya kyonggiensis TaxID=1037680 RepID=A0A4V5P156_9BACI|nr:hypothetical protein [Robertmurraya kyonggiensis]TKC16820.1 hypothetical protein FA727_12185 [Robertmurraya kyonggiensis]
MKLNTVKGKIVAGVVTVGLVSGVGAAFASTDIGAQLQSWYNGKFTSSAASMEKPLTDYVASKAGYIYSEGTKMVNGAKGAINGTRDTEKADSEATISNSADERIDALVEKKGIIFDGIDDQFDSIKGYALTLLDQLAAEGERQADNYLKGVTNSTGTAAVNDVNDHLTNVKNDAVGELNAEIAKAKTELLGELENQKNLTVGELKAAVDAKIAEVKSVLEGKLAGYVSAQQTLIQQKAADLEAAAETELDSAVATGFQN